MSESDEPVLGVTSLGEEIYLLRVKNRDQVEVYDDVSYRLRRRLTVPNSGAARGRGEASPLWVDVQKLCNMCVLSLSWNFFVSHDKYIARPSSKEPR